MTPSDRILKMLSATNLPDLNADSSAHDIFAVVRAIIDKLVPYILRRAAKRRQTFDVTSGPGVDLGRFLNDDRFEHIKFVLDDDPSPKPGVSAVCIHSTRTRESIVKVFSCRDSHLVQSNKFKMILAHEFTHALQDAFGVHKNLPLSHNCPVNDQLGALSTSFEVQAYVTGLAYQFALETKRPPEGYTTAQFWSWAYASYPHMPFLSYASEAANVVARQEIAKILLHDASAAAADKLEILDEKRAIETEEHNAPPVAKVASWKVGDKAIVVGLYDKKYPVTIERIKNDVVSVRFKTGAVDHGVPVANLRRPK